jgi:hypothetical protein
MAMSLLLRFGPFTFEPHTGALWREAERLPLPPLSSRLARVGWPCST